MAKNLYRELDKAIHDRILRDPKHTRDDLYPFQAGFLIAFVGNLADKYPEINAEIALEIERLNQTCPIEEKHHEKG